MAGGKISIEIDGDELKAVKAFAALSDSQKGLVKDLGKTGKAAEDAADKGIKAIKKELMERRKQVGMAQRLVKSHQTVKEAFLAEVAALKTGRKEGELSNEEYAKTIKRITEKYKAEGAAAKEAEEQGSAAFQEKERRAKSGEQSVKRLIKANQTLDHQYDEIRRDIKAAFDGGKISVDQYRASIRHADDEQEKLAAQQKKGFGQKAIGQVAKFAAGFATVATAVAAVRKALEFYNAEKEKAIGTTDSLVDVRTSLRQISKGDFNELESRADTLATDSTLGIDRVKARELVFAARSTGFEGEEKTVAQADPVIPVAAGQIFAGQFRQQFSNDNLSIENAFDTALTAAEQSVYDINQLLPQLQKAAQGAKGIGASSSDVAAVTSVFAGQFGEASGQRVRMLQENIGAEEGLKGLDLIEAIEKLRDDDSMRSEFIDGNKQLGTVVNAAISSLKDFTLDGKKVAGIKTVDSAIEKAQTDSVRVLQEKVAEALDGSRSGKIERSRRRSIASNSLSEVSNEFRHAEEAFGQKSFRDRAVSDISDAPLPIRALSDASVGTLQSVGVGNNATGVITAAIMNAFAPGSGSTMVATTAIEASAAEERKRQTEVLEQIMENTTQQPSTLPLSEPGQDR